MYVVEQQLAAAVQYNLTVTFLPLPVSGSEFTPVIYSIGYQTDGATLHTITMVLRRTGGAAEEMIPIANIVDTRFSFTESLSSLYGAPGAIVVPRVATIRSAVSSAADANPYEFNFTTVGKAEDASFIMNWGWRKTA